MGLENYEVLPVEAQDVQIVQVDAVERANVDSQVATAKQYPEVSKGALTILLLWQQWTQKQLKVAGMRYLAEESLLPGRPFTLQRLLFPIGEI